MTTLSSRCTATPARSHGLLLTNIQNPNPLPKGTSSRLPYVDASLPDGMDEATAEAQRRMAVNIRLREFYVQTINISSPGSDRPWQITPLGPEDRDLCDEGGLMVRHRDSVTLLRTKKHGRAFSMLALFGEDAVTQRAATPAPEGSVATPVAVHTRGTIVPREAHASVSSFVQDADRRQLAAALAPVPGPAPPYSSNEHLEEPQKGRSHWLVTFVLLASEMIGIVVAVMPWVFSRYGTWLGTIVIIAVQLISIAGSCALSKFCIQHPSCQDIFGVASLIFSRHRRGMILASFTFLSYLANAIVSLFIYVMRHEGDLTESGCHGFPCYRRSSVLECDAPRHMVTSLLQHPLWVSRCHNVLPHLFGTDFEVPFDRGGLLPCQHHRCASRPLHRYRATAERDFGGKPVN